MLDQGYGLMPNCILYNKELTDKQKLLFCTISSLCAEKWYCRATNEYIWELLGADKSTISRNISVLQEKWFIGVEIDQNYKRKITLCKNSKGDMQKWVGGDTQKWVDNNTSDKITNKNSLAKFEEFWNKRPKKEDKKKAKQKFMNLSPEKQQKAIDWIDRRKKSDRWQRWIIMWPAVYINNERREDEIETKEQKPNTLVYH
jgi:SOS-response transcriptional repressor LexA